MNVEFSSEAIVDLEKIGDWIAQENPLRAASFVGELRTECLGLADFPERYQVYKEIELGKLRRKVYGN